MRLHERAQIEQGRLKEQGLERQLRHVQERAGSELRLEGHRCIDFCSNDYLGLAGDPRLAEVLGQGLRAHGSGSGASRLVSGSHVLHAEAEATLADFVGQPAAALFSSGYAANAGMLSALAEQGRCDLQRRPQSCQPDRRGTAVARRGAHLSPQRPRAPRGTARRPPRQGGRSACRYRRALFDGRRPRPRARIAKPVRPLSCRPGGR